MPGLTTEFKHTLRRLRGQVLGWGIGLALYGLLMGAMYDAINNITGLEDILANYPPEMMAFFGDRIALNTPEGYFGTYYSSYMPIIVGIFAAGAAAGLLAGDEERGTLDLTLSYPVSRTALFWGRWMAYALATALILFIGYLGWAVTLPMTAMDVTWSALLRPFLPLWAVSMLFGALALLLSLILPSARMASMIAGALLVANFLLAGLANLNDNLRPIMDVTPFAFLQSGARRDLIPRLLHDKTGYRKAKRRRQQAAHIRYRLQDEERPDEPVRSHHGQENAKQHPQVEDGNAAHVAVHQALGVGDVQRPHPPRLPSIGKQLQHDDDPHHRAHRPPRDGRGQKQQQHDRQKHTDSQRKAAHDHPVIPRQPVSLGGDALAAIVHGGHGQPHHQADHHHHGHRLQIVEDHGRFGRPRFAQPAEGRDGIHPQHRRNRRQ